MTPIQSEALKLFENQSESPSTQGLSKTTVGLIGLATTSALCCLGIINPGVGVLIGAGCALMTQTKSSLEARHQAIEEARVEFDLLGLKPVHVITVKSDVMLVSFGNDQTAMSDSTLDLKITKIAHKLLDSLSGQCLLARSEHAIGFKISP